MRQYQQKSLQTHIRPHLAQVVEDTQDGEEPVTQL